MPRPLVLVEEMLPMELSVLARKLQLLVAMPPDQTGFFGHYNLWTLLFSVFSPQAFYTVTNIVERYFLKSPFLVFMLHT